jgi:hypothetical protein
MISPFVKCVRAGINRLAAFEVYYAPTTFRPMYGIPAPHLIDGSSKLFAASLGVSFHAAARTTFLRFAKTHVNKKMFVFVSAPLLWCAA